MKYTYDVSYRLDDIEDYDSTEYSETFNRKADAKKYANSIKKKYKDRVVLLDINRYDKDGFLEDTDTIV